MSIALWVLQILLALMFLMSGSQKAFRSEAKLHESFPWAQDFPLATVRFIGITQLLAAVGLILPAATGIWPILTPIAAVGLAITMLLAMVVHYRRKENSAIGFNAVLLVLAVVVAWGRFGPYAL